MALGLTLGIVLALSGGNSTRIDQSSLGSPKPSPASTAPAQPHHAQRPPPQLAVSSRNTDCDIIVPARPLSARGLSTPYQLTGPAGKSPAGSGCTTTGAGLGIFVQATILDPATGALSVYHPPVVTQGARLTVPPVVPRLPPHAIVTIDFGFNGTNLTQVGATSGALAQGHCVSGPGPVSFCNGSAFFQAALALMRQGRLHVPSGGTSANMVATGGRLGTGRDCPNVRNFEVAGQDQGVGVLVDDFLDPVFGCKPFTAPDLADKNKPATSLALDELLAARNEPRVAALVPESDEAVLGTGGQLDPARTSAYRAELGQPPVSAQNDKNDSPAAYCQNMINIQAPFLAANQDVLAAEFTPVPGPGKNLLTFLASRLSTSFSSLGCRKFGLTDPVTLVRDGAGAATSASFDTTPQQATAVGGRSGSG
jgi:hypothetical protein